MPEKLAAVTLVVWRLALRRFLSVRFLIGLIAAGQGYYRLTMPGATAALSYGDNQLFGWGLIVFGLAVLVTQKWHLSLAGRVCATGLCVTYGMLFAAVLAAPASALTSFFFAVAMLAEAGTYD